MSDEKRNNCVKAGCFYICEDINCKYNENPEYECDYMVRDYWDEADTNCTNPLAIKQAESEGENG